MLFWFLVLNNKLFSGQLITGVTFVEKVLFLNVMYVYNKIQTWCAFQSLEEYNGSQLQVFYFAVYKHWVSFSFVFFCGVGYEDFIAFLPKWVCLYGWVGCLYLACQSSWLILFSFHKKKKVKRYKNTTCRIFVLEVPESLLESVREKMDWLILWLKGFIICNDQRNF